MLIICDFCHLCTSAGVHWPELQGLNALMHSLMHFCQLEEWNYTQCAMYILFYELLPSPIDGFTDMRKL